MESNVRSQMSGSLLNRTLLQVCQQGECKGSICAKFGLAPCFLTSDTGMNKRQLCELACQSNTSTCMSLSDLVSNGELTGSLEHGLSLLPGSPCDNFKGYCDFFLKCRHVNAEGPLVRLKNVLFNKVTLQNIVQWVTEFWWVLLLICIGFVVIMIIFIKCFKKSI